MITFSRELTVAWGESDPFGLVYYPMMFTWFNETEHELLRNLGFGTKDLIENHRTAFVMGDVHFRFTGPAAYGDRVRTTMQLAKLGGSTVHWNCKAVHVTDGAVITEGRAIRIYAQIQEDGSLKALEIPDEIRDGLSDPMGPLNLPEDT